MTRSLLRFLPALVLTAVLVVGASPAQALLHIIDFSDSEVTGSFDVDDELLIPNTNISCNSPTCGGFNFFTVTFAPAVGSGAEFTLDDLPGEVMIGRVGAGGFVDGLFILMGDNESMFFLEMDDDPNTFNINPMGTYTISVPEPGLVGLLACSAAGLLALRRRR